MFNLSHAIECVMYFNFTKSSRFEWFGHFFYLTLILKNYTEALSFITDHSKYKLETWPIKACAVTDLEITRYDKSCFEKTRTPIAKSGRWAGIQRRVLNFSIPT